MVFPTETTDQKIDKLIDQFNETIAAAMVLAFTRVKDRASITDLTAAIQSGNSARVVQLLSINAAAMRPVTAAIEAAFEAGGDTVAAGAPRSATQGVFLFDVRSTSAETWLRDESSRLVTRISEEQADNIRAALDAGMRAGNNPTTTALELIGRYDPATGHRVGGIVGLTRPQSQYVANARAELQNLDANYFTRELRDKRFDGTVRKAIASETSLPDATIEKLVTRYTDALLKLRGDTIGRTESLASLNQAQHESIGQAVSNGLITVDAVEKEWDSAGDNRVRPDHIELDGTVVALNDPFIAPDGSKLMHPGDTSLGASAREVINCRCRARYKVDWFKDID